MTVELARTLGNILIFVSFIPFAAFVVMYHVIYKWYESEYGRNMMSFMLVIAAVLGLACIRQIFGDSPMFQLIRAITFLGVPIVGYWRLVLLFKSWKEAKEDAARESNSA